MWNERGGYRRIWGRIDLEGGRGGKGGREELKGTGKGEIVDL